MKDVVKNIGRFFGLFIKGIWIVVKTIIIWISSLIWRNKMDLLKNLFWGILVVALVSASFHYGWIERISGTKPAISVAIISVARISDVPFTNLSDSNELDFLLEALEKTGTITQRDVMPPIIESNDNENFCTISSLLSPLDGEEIKTPDYTEYLLKDKLCEDCYEYIIYGGNSGNKKVDVIQFDICFKDNIYISPESVSIGEIRNDHCIRKKINNVFSDDDFFLRFGVIAKDLKPSAFIGNVIQSVDIKYNVWNKVESVPKNNIFYIRQLFISDCTA
jgi:hypothetical protein